VLAAPPLRLLAVPALCVAAGVGCGSTTVPLSTASPPSPHAAPPSAPGDPHPGPPDGVRIFTGEGAPSDWETLQEAMERAEVILLGEVHDDAVGHRARHHLVRELAERTMPSGGDGAAAGEAAGAEASLVLSLEMFERDVQGVLDEYLAGLISEDHFLQAARPWENYDPDYRPYVELARERKLPLVAANPPRRYVNRVARLGSGSLDDLPPEALDWLPPLPYAPPSEQYREEGLRSLQGAEGHGHGHGPSVENMLQAQTLWDAGMADAIARALVAHPEARVVHVAGAFHVAGGTGLPEHLEGYRPGTETLTVVAYPVDPASGFDPDRHHGRGDFVLLTPR
jgi:uncharacterized iron-regulated protein